MYERIKIAGLGPFVDLDLRVAPGLNILVGENATGKTHLLKLAYAIQKSHHFEETAEQAGRTLEGVFRPNSLGRLVHRGQSVRTGSATIRAFGGQCRLSLHSKSSVPEMTSTWDEPPLPVFVPAKDTLVDSLWMPQFVQRFQIGVEDVYPDILAAAMVPARRGRVPDLARRIMRAIRQPIGGTPRLRKDRRFYLVGKEGALEFPLVAEGLRKLSLLYLLAQNGSLEQGSVLFWDEPESNLNPGLFGPLAKAVWLLVESGVQVFLATHSFGMIRRLEFERPRSQPADRLSIHGFSRAEGSGVEVRTVGSYEGIQPNSIEDEYRALYELELKRAGARAS